MAEESREIILDVIECSLEAQLRAVRRLRKAQPMGKTSKPPKRRSQIGIVYDILSKARQPLHVLEIIARAQKTFGRRLDRESLVSALSKRVARQDRFRRTAPNTFALIAPSTVPGKQEEN